MRDQEHFYTRSDRYLTLSVDPVDLKEEGLAQSLRCKAKQVGEK